MNSRYVINKGVGKPISFKGLQGQWIGWLCVGLMLLLFLFTLCYIAGAALVACIIFVFTAGILLFYVVYKYNHRYGEHGLMKEMARRVTPKRILCDQILTGEKSL